MELLSSRSWPQIPKIQNNRGVSRIPYLSCVLRLLCLVGVGDETRKGANPCGGDRRDMEREMRRRG